MFCWMRSDRRGAGSTGAGSRAASGQRGQGGDVAFALEKLGAGYRFVTRVLATGPVQGGIVQGDIVLVGGGDPTLQTDQLGDLVARLAKAGLQGATGRFLYWDGALPRLTQIAADQPAHVGYNAASPG
jgi:D-alanyl-D-alanine carboxypeptidase/D-alanyl-D-alanine-endopeptidase (penicillin-binding protein 4)